MSMAINDYSIIPNDLNRPLIKAVIMAAGESSRFKGGHKALAPPLGPGFLARAVKVLSLAGLSSPVVVVGHRGPEVAAEAESLGAAPVANPEPDLGMLSSVKTGLKAAQDAEAAVMLPVDAAFVSGAAVLGAIGRYLALGEAASGLAVIPAHDGQTGHPPVLGREIFKLVLDWTGKGGLRGALASLAGSPEAGAAILSGQVPGAGSGSLRFYDSPDPGVLCDIDTEDDLARALGRSVPNLEPDLPSVLALLRLAGPERKRPHSVTVAVLALRLAAALKSKAMELVFMGGLLHDVDHGPSRHDLAAAKRLAEIGWPDLAAVVGAHTELPPAWTRIAGYDGPAGDRHADDAALYDGKPDEVVEAAVLVHMADKYVKGEKLVTLDERFGAFVAYGGDPEVLTHVRRRWNAALAIERRLSERLGRAPIEAMAAPSGHSLEDLAGRLLGRAPWSECWDAGR